MAGLLNEIMSGKLKSSNSIYLYNLIIVPCLDRNFPIKRNTGNRFSTLLGTDYVEFYVGNAKKQAAHYYKQLLDFNQLAYAAPKQV